MRHAVTLALVLAATTASRQGCGRDRTLPAYDPCGGKACGERCTACAPDDPGCVETMELKACDRLHRCVSARDGMCEASPSCAGMACGAACVIEPACVHETPPCAVASIIGYCSGDGGQCLTVPPLCPAPPPSWGCVGKACGDSCGVCPEGTDPSRCPVPTFAATACDPLLQCVTVGTFTCSPEEACRGKACGAACETCPACMRPYAMACDGSATCVPAPVTCGP